MKAVKGKVTGKVQGVFFRLKTKEHADRLGLTGWVRNTPHGCVEFMIIGEEAALVKMKRWLGQGPSLARVDSLELEDCPLECLPDFSILY